MHSLKYLLLSSLAVFPSLVPAQQTSASLPPTQQLARDILKELVEINTTDTPEGNVTTAAEAMAARFRKAGFPEADLKVLGPIPNKGNLVVRLRGRGQGKPILFVGNLAVVQP